jgi:AcrR family transcriptional regulator
VTDSATPTSSDKRKKILEVALKLFTSMGFHETRLDEVAKQADIAKGTLYLYFKSKEDLFIQCLFDGSERWMERAQVIIDSQNSIKERFLRLIELQVEAFTHNGPLVQQFIQSGRVFSANSALTGNILEKMKERIGIFAGFFEAGIKSGDFCTCLSPMQMALIFHQIFDLNMKFNLFQIPALTPEKCHKLLLSLFNSEEQLTAQGGAQ